MKKLLLILFLLVSAWSFGQNMHVPSFSVTSDSLTGNWAISKVFIPWNTFRVKRVSVTGSDSLKAFGDSYTTGFNGYNTYGTRNDVAIFANRYNLTLANYAVGGTGVFVAAKAGSLNITPISNNTINWFRAGFNDIKRAVYYNAATYKKIASCLNSIIAQNVIDSIYFAGSDAHLVKTGGWTTNLDAYSGFGGKAAAGAWGGTAAFSNTAGDSIKTTFVGDAVIIGYGNQTTGGFTGGNFNYYIDDSLAGNQVCDGADGISDGTNSNLVSPGALLIKGCGSGLHKLTIKLTNATFTYIDYVATVKPFERIAPTIISLVPHLLAAGYAVSPAVVNGTTAFDSGDSTILATAYRWEPYNVAVVFPMDYFNPSTDLSLDNVHPTIPQGYQHLSYAIMDRVSRDNVGMLGTFQFGPSVNPTKANISLGTNGGFPYISWYYKGAAANEHLWDSYVDATTFQIRMVNDAFNTGVNAIQFKRALNVLKIVNSQTDSVLIQGNPGPSTNTFDLTNPGGRVRVNSTMQLNNSPIVPDANYVASVGTSFIRLPVISANRNFTFPTARQGDIMEILDSNTAAFTWNLPTTALDAQNNTISSLFNKTFYRFIHDGGSWRVMYQSPYPSGQTTLVSGTKAITINGLTTSGVAIVTLVAQGGTSTTTYQYKAVCTANTLTITAVTTAGATVTTDTSIINYKIESP